MLKLVNHQSRLGLGHSNVLHDPDDSNFAFGFGNHFFGLLFFFFFPEDFWLFWVSSLNFYLNSMAFFFVFFGSHGHDFLLFPGRVARFAIALGDVKFSEPLINGPKPASLQLQLRVSWHAETLGQGQEKDNSVKPRETEWLIRRQLSWLATVLTYEGCKFKSKAFAFMLENLQ